MEKRKQLRELEDNRITKTKMFSWNETRDLIQETRKETLTKIKNIIKNCCNPEYKEFKKMLLNDLKELEKK